MGAPLPLDVDRRALLGLAYRMLGSVADAEDVLQDALVRWHERESTTVVESPRAFMSQIVVRLCLDRLKSARARRETYVGPWLPDPVVDDRALTPDAASELASDLSVALLLILERLSPLERAAFLLHDVFDTEWPEVAKSLGRSEEACRQLASRARARVKDERPRYRPSEEQQTRVMVAFGHALQTGNVGALAGLLTEDAVFLSDSNGLRKAALKPVLGRDRVSRLLVGLQNKSLSVRPDAVIRPATINGLPGVLLFEGEALRETAAFDIDEDGLVRAVYVVVNPEKLRHLARHGTG